MLAALRRLQPILAVRDALCAANVADGPGTGRTCVLLDEGSAGPPGVLSPALLRELVARGVPQGLLLIIPDRLRDGADRPGARQLGRAADLPVLEPADADEAAAMLAAGFALSTEFACPAILRLSGDAPSSPTPAARGECRREMVADRNEGRPIAAAEPSGEASPAGSAAAASRVESDRGIALVSQARARELANYADGSELNRLERGRGTRAARRYGFIAAGPVYHRVRAAYPEAVVLRIGMPHPLPLKHVRGITEMCRVVVVVEHGEPFIECELRAEGFRVHGADLLSRCGGIGSATLNAALESLAGESRRSPR